MKSVRRNDVRSLFLSGVRAIEEIVASFEGDDWANTTCGEWDAADTARHLVGVIDWYEDWLDRAIEGHSDPPFAPAEFEVRNAAGIAELKHLDGPTAIAEFARRARDYLDRAGDRWNIPFGYPPGTITVGLHLGIAATEWNLHAWDLASGQGRLFQPEEPALLFKAAGSAVAATKEGLQGQLLGLVVPLASKRSPWNAILKESGRTP